MSPIIYSETLCSADVYNGEVKNLGVADAEIWIDPKSMTSAAGKGILVDWMGKSKISNCWTSGSIYSGTKIRKEYWRRSLVLTHAGLHHFRLLFNSNTYR